jgi:hypothetical protein
MRLSVFKIISVFFVALSATIGAASAQYSPIPNFTGIGAGSQFCQAINNRFAGVGPISPQMVACSFASLPSEQDGSVVWCKDCIEATPCAGSGSGAWAFGRRGQCSCGYPALESNLNGGSYRISAVTLDATTGGTISPERTVGTSASGGEPQLRDATLTKSYGQDWLFSGGIRTANRITTNSLVVGPGAVLITGNQTNGADQISNVNVNGVLNVKTYGAKGDGTTDDTAAINAAIAASCATSGTKPPVYFPPTPNSSYLISSPIILNCTTSLIGAGEANTTINANNFPGPAIIAQAQETGWKPPLTTNITRTWQASHSYGSAGSFGPSYDIVDPNGNIEIQTNFSGCTSGATQPSWPTATVGTSTTDNTCTWILATTGGSKTIVSGSGASLDVADNEFFNNAGYGNSPAIGNVDLGTATGLDYQLRGLGAFTFEFYILPVVNDGGASQNINLMGIHMNQPNYGWPYDSVALRLNGNTCSQGYDCLAASVYLGASSVYVAPTTSSNLLFGKVNHVALTYDGTTVRLFINGTMVNSAGGSGTLTIPYFSNIMIGGDYDPQEYGGENPGQNYASGLYDSYRFSNIARYTANFTPPNAKFAWDSNTLFLANFPTSAPTGTIEAEVSGKNAFIPLETSNGAADLNPVTIRDMTIENSGEIYANWMLNSVIENVSFYQGGAACVFLHDNDYQDKLRNVSCQVVPISTRTAGGFLLENQSNNNLYEHLQCDGTNSCVFEHGGSGTYILPDYTDRGLAVYPFAFHQAQAILISPTTDIEDSDANFQGDVYNSQSYAPLEIHGGQLSAPNSGTPPAYLVSDWQAYPYLVEGTDFAGGGTPSELIKYNYIPNAPSVLQSINYPSGLAITNSGYSYWAIVKQGAQDLGMKFADLPSCSSSLNGVTRFLTDGTVGATCSGSGTGAWARCMGTAWNCN